MNLSPFWLTVHSLLVHPNPSTDVSKPLQIVNIEARDTDPFLHANPKTYEVPLPVRDWHLGFTLKSFPYHNMPYIVHTNASSKLYYCFAPEHRHNSWILAVNKNEPISADKVLLDIKKAKRDGDKTINFLLVKRYENIQRKALQCHRATFNRTSLSVHLFSLIWSHPRSTKLLNLN